MVDELRDVLSRCGRLSVDVGTLRPDDDLYEAGLTSLACVNVMLAIEDRFEVEFSDDLLTRRTFQSMSALARVVAELGGRDAR